MRTYADAAVLVKVGSKPKSEPEGGDAEECDDLDDYLRLWGQVKLAYADVCWRMLTYADVC